MIQRRSAADFARGLESKVSREFPIADGAAFRSRVEPVSTDEIDSAHKAERLAAYLRARDR